MGISAFAPFRTIAAAVFLMEHVTTGRKGRNGKDRQEDQYWKVTAFHATVFYTTKIAKTK